jgi:TonB family protein
MIGQMAVRRRNPGKERAFAVSLGLHVAAFFALMYTPPFGVPSLPPPSPSEYQQAFAGKEDKIVWYKFRDLPEITPRKAPEKQQPLRAETKASQAIVSSPKNAPKRNQVVLTPSPITDLPPLELPNLLAVKLPPKQFTTPPDLIRPEAAQVEAPVAPDARSDLKVDAAKLPKAFLPPQAAAPKQMARIEAPSEAKDYVADSKLPTKLPADRLPSRAFVPPPAREAPARPNIGPAVEVPAAAANSLATAAMPSAKLPGRAFVPPSSTAAGAQNKKTIAAPQIDAPPGDITIAIAGLNPSTSPVKLPAASSPAQFSAGEKVRPDGATSDGAGKGITVPDLYAKAPAGEKKTDLLALATVNPSSKEFMTEALRRNPPVASGEATVPSPAQPRTTATRVSSAPDPRFNGRDVYMMAIQMSNLTSYTGSWLMWYAARSARQAEMEPIAAPVPHRKVDPKYLPSAVSDHVEGRVQIFCVIGREGTVTSIELLRGADERLNRSAEEALSKWEFYPATRNGQPVDVDVVVEIPFALAPPTPLR